MKIQSTCIRGLLLLTLLPAATGQGSTGQTIEGGRLVDHDYAFSIEVPDDGWRLFDEEAIQEIVPDAVAGMAKIPGTVFGCVIIEHAPGSSPDAYASLIIDNSPVEEKEVESRETLRFQGHDAVRYSLSGRIEGLHVRYHNVVVVRGDHVYQILSWALMGQPGLRSLDVLSDGFRFVDGEVRGRSSSAAVLDLAGAGWRVEGGVFESAAHRFRLAPGEGWRIVCGDELRLMNPDACIGIESEDASVYGVVICEAAHVVDQDAFGGHVVDLFAESVGRNAVAERELAVDGNPRSFTVYGVDFGVALEFCHSVVFHDDMCYQLLVWYPTADRERSAELVPAALDGLSFLDAAEVAKLAGELAGAPDPDVAVGPWFSLRAGTYRDFAGRILWRKPDHGYWTAYAGQAAREQNPDCNLYFYEESTGLIGTLVIEPGIDVDGVEYHAAVLGIIDTDDSVDADDPVEHELAGHPAISSVLDVDTGGGLPMMLHVTTFVHSGTAVQLVLSGARENLMAAGDTIAAAVAGLGILPHDVDATVYADGTFEDWRMGYGLRVPEGFEEPRQTTPPEMQAVGSITVVPGPDGMLMALAVSSTDRMSEELLLDVATPIMRRSLDRARLEEAEPFTVEIAGREATARRWQDGERHFDLYVVKRSRTLYGFIVAGDEVGLAGSMRECFLLLD